MAIPNGIYQPPPLSSGGVVVKKWNTSTMGAPVGPSPGIPGASRLHNDPIFPEAVPVRIDGSVAVIGTGAVILGSPIINAKTIIGSTVVGGVS